MPTDDEYTVTEALDQSTGVVHRLYSYRRKRCHRVKLTGKIAAQLAGYTLIEKDLRSASAWLDEINGLNSDDPRIRGEQYGRGKDRKKYLLIKGLFVAALTFYGKCFSKCEGRPVKLERANLDDKFLELHDECMEYRHNFAAHSGAASLEYVEVALVMPRKRKASILPQIYTELFQPDLMLPDHGQATMNELFEHVREIAQTKRDRLAMKILKDEVLPKGIDYWLSRNVG